MTESGVTRVVVGEDQPIFREGIVHVLEGAGFEVVGTAADGPELARKLRAHRPDVVVSDIQMPPTHTDEGLRAVIEARRAAPGLGVLVLSQFLDDGYVLDLMADGSQGVGYMLKDKVAEIATFTDAVRRVANGDTALDPDVVATLVGRRRAPGPLDDLTKREREVLALIAEGRSNPGIAQQLVVSVGAVEHHVTHIFDKLGLRDGAGDHRRVLAVLRYLEQ